MKYAYVLVGLVLAALAGWIYFANQTDQSTQDVTLEETVSKTAAVMPLSAEVSVGVFDTWNVIATTSTVEDGAEVKTSADGRAIVSVETSIISSLDNNSEMTIHLSSDKEQSQLAITAGAVWSKVARALEQDEVFEVYTPTMVAAVRGTSFGVSLNPKRSLVVTEGIVWVTRRNPTTAERIATSTIEVTAGNTVEDDGVHFIVRPSTPADRDTWYYLNNPKPEDTDAVSILDTFVPPVVTTPAPVTIPSSPTPAPVAASGPTISSVSPQRFDPKTIDKIRVSGEHLREVTEVRLNNKPVEFIVTSVGVVVIDTSEFREGYKAYDLAITSPSGTATKRNAFILEEEEINLEITNTSFTYDQSQASYIYIRGPGMRGVDTVLIDNQSTQFEITSDTELRVAYPFLETTKSVEVRADGQSARGTVSP